ncbi:hypothetical protein [Chromobacterium subtsugae]|uniref:hypothetical protein n=1 Tax=Chromobacterium subtsugae TaxID=251747 RepID=UPI000640CDBD|nr:hypothetical protein [Chromobacterium subtsugae]
MSDYRGLFDAQPPRAQAAAPEAARPDPRALFDRMPGAPGAADARPPAAPASIATPTGLQRRYDELLRQNEGLAHRVIDLAQSLKLGETRLDQQFRQAQRQAQELQQLMRPRWRLPWGQPAADKTRGHQLIDQLQGFLRSEMKPDVFISKDMDELQRQTGYLERLSATLQTDAGALLPPDAELRQRIGTQAHILAMQAASSRQLIEQLQRQLQDIEDWRANFLSLLVIDIQQRL